MSALPLQTERLRLRPFTRADLPAFTAYRADPAVARYQSWSSYSAEQAEQFYAGQQDLQPDTDGTWYQLAVEHGADAILLGDVAVHFFDEGRQAELGVTFATAQQGQGYAREALAAVLQWLFSALGKHRVVATVDTLNLPAQHLLQHLGFRREGHFRQNILFKGAWGDEYSYALLASEWRQTLEAAQSRD